MTGPLPAGTGQGNKRPRHSRRLSDELVEDARALFQERTDRTLTSEDARQMLENLVGFFSVLIEWNRDEALMSTESNGDTTIHAASQE
ncbi:hypothetical protein [Novosphingobium sp. LASN5T]|uniref:hypothetical protein n=1 Tax=Novosphingobium sp. LASN5T TaxID=2491021 RepID=UPI000F5D93A5|nr:hypothetical protein [Novosphingobium sp. LASN5T]RQW46083.1 hypothetical protein EH199_01605 [Novosphingobium sp. LASN5T]